MHLPIQNCSFEFECPRDYQRLAKTEDANIRFCSACSCNVYRCCSLDELAEHSQAGRCVSLVVTPCTSDNAKVGDIVRITSGTFEGFDATIESLDREQEAAEVMVHVFGRVRPTPAPFNTLAHAKQS